LGGVGGGFGVGMGGGLCVVFWGVGKQRNLALLSKWKNEFSSLLVNEIKMRVAAKKSKHIHTPVQNGQE